MKKVAYIALVLIFICTLSSCFGKKRYFKLEENSVNISVGDSYQIRPSTNVKKAEYLFEYDEQFVKVENGLIYALKVGTTTIKISIKGSNVEAVNLILNIDNKNGIEILGPSIGFVNNSIVLELNKEVDKSNIEWISSNEEVATVENGIVNPLKKGQVTITVKETKRNIMNSITIEIYDAPSGDITSSKKIISIGEKIQLNATFVADITPIFSSSNDNVAVVSETGLVTGLSEGSVTIYVLFKNEVYDYTASINLTISQLPEKIVFNDSLLIEAGGEKDINPTIVPSNAPQEFILTSSDETIVSINNNLIKGLKEGKALITISSKADSSIKTTFEVTVKSRKAPTLSFIDEKTKNVNINWNKQINYLDGVKAFDEVDGDLTSKIKVIGSVDNQVYGDYIVKYEVVDSVGNKASLERKYTVVWKYDVTFIGHAGSFYGLMNSEKAILYALEKLHYQAIECDVKQTSDGVFVISHDDTFGEYAIASTPWSVLKDVEITKTRNSGIPKQNGSVVNGTYTTKLCTFERYLDLCKQYNARPVIELKASAGITNSDQSRMQALMDVIESKNMLDDIIFLGSQYNCLIWTRTHGYSNVECQYLVNSCESDTVLNRCIDNNLDVSINVTGDYSNNDEWLAKYFEKGIKISTYTFTQYVDYDVVQTWIDKGVQFVTCDWQLMSKLNLPESLATDTKEHSVVFKDYDGTILKETTVRDGKTAASPSNPIRDGYSFTGWDKPIRNVKSDLIVNATYEIIEYNIYYDDNLKETSEVSFDSKAEFIKELYQDMYNYFIENGSKLANVTIADGKVTISKNGKTAIFASAEELLGVDKYDFEKTVSNYIYKPVKRNNDGSCDIVRDENYFLNSSKYIAKYQNIDKWLVNAVKAGYPAYDNTYTPKNDGRIQIFFRMQQWASGTAISAFEDIPKKFAVVNIDGVDPVMPTTCLTYNINSEFILPIASGNVKFIGWYLDKECTKPITEITKGMFGTIIVYAKWNFE